MKKSLISLILILLAQFCAINLTCCAEDFFIDSNFQEAKNKIKLPDNKTIQKVSDKVENSKKSGLLSKFLDKKEKNTKFNYATNKNEEIPKGYYGTLPDIKGDFKYKQQSQSSSRQTDFKVPDSTEEIDDKNLKNAPYDDALFLDMVIKKDKTSNYINDVQKTKFALLNLKKCIEEQGDIQRFNACVNSLDLYVQNLKKKYEKSSESLKESYIDILSTNYHSKVLGNLKYDANYYARYIPTSSQGKYSKENINAQEQKLLNRVNKTLFLINNET